MIKNIQNFLNDPKNSSKILLVLLLTLLLAFGVVNVQITLTFGGF
jgi:predicted type IV restriction endonuclease